MGSLSIVEYMNYLSGTNSSRCVYEGEEVLNAGHIILCGKLSSSTPEKVSICALCLQSSALNSDPHQIEGELMICERENVKIINMSCSCKAGNSGRCKHISAVLIKCTRKNVQEFEIISQTDLKCVWSTQKHVTKEKYSVVPIKDMPCFKNSVEQCNLKIDEDKLYNFFIERLPEAAISKHRAGRRILNDSLASRSDMINDVNDYNAILMQYYYNAILNNACQSVLMLEISSLEVNNENECCKEWYLKLFGMSPETLIATTQRSQEWHTQRKFRVTGSRIYELYTYSKNEWKIKSMKYFYSKSFTNKYTQHGIKYESDARELFIKQTSFHVIECGMVVSHSNPWLGYSPDGIIFAEDKPTALLEIKCLFEGATTTITGIIGKIKYLQKCGNKYLLKETHKYYGQVQLGMALLNLTKCYLVLYASFDNTAD